MLIRRAVVALPSALAMAAPLHATPAVAAPTWQAVTSANTLNDTVRPVARMTYPRRTFIVGPTFRAAWSGHDDQSVIRDFDVRMRSAYYNGALSRWGRWQHHTTRTRVRFKPGEGHAYCFSVRARDRAGNVGPWSRRRCSSGAIDDRSASVSREWSRRHRDAAYHNTLTNTRRAGARMVLRQVHARDLRLVARTCRRCGSVVVRFDGHRLGVFDLTSHSTRDRRVLRLADYRRVHTGRLMIRVVSHGKPVRIDGIVATR